MSKDYPTFFTSIPDTQIEHLTPLRCYTLPAVLCNTYRTSPSSMEFEKDNIYRITERVSAHILDLKDAAVLDEILRWAKEQEVGELVALDRDSVKHALMREVPNRMCVGEGVYRCGFCGVHVHSGDNYCHYCGQKLR